MTGKRANLQRGGFLAAANLAIALSSLVRSIILARFMSVEDFGITATFLLVTTLAGLATDLGIDRLLIQARDGNRSKLQAAAQAFQVFRGAGGSLVLWMLAGPLAALFGVPEARWAFELLALVPFARGLNHLDIARMQRRMRFAPIALSETVPWVLSAALAAPLAMWLGDYRAGLWVILIQVACGTIMSHATAQRPYRLRWDKGAVLRLLDFGWPLLISSMVVFGTQQGDRFLMGAAIGVEELGWFSAAFAVALVPATIVSRVCSSFFLPLLSKAQPDAHRFSALSTTMSDVSLTLGVCCAVGLAIAGPSLFLLLFGERYAAGIAVLGLFGAAQCFGIARVAPGTIAMARGDTKILMIAGIVRIAFLAPALASVWGGFGALGIAASGLAGEVAAYIAAVALLKSRLGLNVSHYLLPSAVAAVIVGVTLIASAELISGRNPWIEIPAAAPALLVVVLLCIAAMPRLFRQSIDLLRMRRTPV